MCTNNIVIPISGKLYEELCDIKARYEIIKPFLSSYASELLQYLEDRNIYSASFHWTDDRVNNMTPEEKAECVLNYLQDNERLIVTEIKFR